MRGHEARLRGSELILEANAGPPDIALQRTGARVAPTRPLTASVAGATQLSYDLQLTRYGDEGWRATFYPAGRGHSVTSAVGSAWEREPWIAVQPAGHLAKREARA